MSTRGKIEDIPEKAGQVMGGGTGGAVLVYVGTKNVEKDRYHKLFKLDAHRELTKKTQRSTTTNTYPKKCSPIISDNELKCLCLNARSIVNKKVS